MTLQSQTNRQKDGNQSIRFFAFHHAKQYQEKEISFFVKINIKKLFKLALLYLKALSNIIQLTFIFLLHAIKLFITIRKLQSNNCINQKSSIILFLILFINYLRLLSSSSDTVFISPKASFLS